MITSTIIWNENINEAPEEENLLLWVRDDFGDSINEYTINGWKVRGTNIWIVDNDAFPTSWIKMWANMPKL